MTTDRQARLRTALQKPGILLLAVVVPILARKLVLGDLGTRIVWVTFYPAETPQHFRLVIEVEDTGEGIDAGGQERIFQPFVQLGHTSDRQGTGLGLAITRQFVDG